MVPLSCAALVHRRTSEPAPATPGCAASCPPFGTASSASSAADAEKRFHEAEYWFKGALKARPEFQSALDQLGVLYYKVQKLHEARAYFAQSDRVNPTPQSKQNLRFIEDAVSKANGNSK